MTSTPETIPSTTAAPHGAAVVWYFDPWRERPRVAGVAALAALGLCLLVTWARLPFVMSAALCVTCVAAFSPALTPVTCRLDPSGVARRGLLGWERRPWSAIRRVEPVPAGVLLSPFGARNALDAARAMVLPIPADRLAELRDAVCRMRAAHGA